MPNPRRPWRPPVRRRGTHVTAHPSPHGARSRPCFPPPPAAQRTPLPLAPFSHKRRRGRASAAGRRALCARAWRGGAPRRAPAPVDGPMACVGSNAPPHPPPRQASTAAPPKTAGDADGGDAAAGGGRNVRSAAATTGHLPGAPVAGANRWARGGDGDVGGRGVCGVHGVRGARAGRGGGGSSSGGGAAGAAAVGNGYAWLRVAAVTGWVGNLLVAVGGPGGVADGNARECVREALRPPTPPPPPWPAPPLRGGATAAATVAVPAVPCA